MIFQVKNGIFQNIKISKKRFSFTKLSKPLCQRLKCACSKSLIVSLIQIRFLLGTYRKCVLLAVGALCGAARRQEPFHANLRERAVDRPTWRDQTKSRLYAGGRPLFELWLRRLEHVEIEVCSQRGLSILEHLGASWCLQEHKQDR